ncbi:hypothetical protein ElyMa_001996300 [Elysia marginata]|uniref:Uncharacterized protein n=1 Tax=Elysia marginata TaxID=1093978 RepID=A0AAV4F2D5_9GAST|nr:hypothetical protein ElyMa_001996300 [Elysia marginata]
MGCRHSQYYGEGGEARVESLHYKQRRSTKLKRSNRHRKKSASSAAGAKDKSSASSATSSRRKSSDLDVVSDHRPSTASSLDRESLPKEADVGEDDEGLHAVAETTRASGKRGKKGKKGKVKGGNKKRDKEKEERRVQQLFGAGHQHTARDALSLSLPAPDGTNGSGVGGALTSTPSSDSLPARLLAHYKRAFPVWQAADYHFRQDGRGLTLSTLSGAGLACQCGKDVEPANGSVGNTTVSGDTAVSPSTSHQSPSSLTSSTAAAVGTSGRQQCRRCSLAAAKRAGLLSSNNNGSVDGGSAAAAAADNDADGAGGAGDNGAAASGASPETWKRRSNVDAIANFLVLVGVSVIVSV